MRTPAALTIGLGIVGMLRLGVGQVTDQDEVPPIRATDEGASSTFARLLSINNEIVLAVDEESRIRERFQGELNRLDSRIRLIEESLEMAQEARDQGKSNADTATQELERMSATNVELRNRSSQIAESLNRFGRWLDAWGMRRLDPVLERGFFERLEEALIETQKEGPDLGNALRQLVTGADELIAVSSRCERTVMEVKGAEEFVGDALRVGSLFAFILTPDRAKGVIREFLIDDTPLSPASLDSSSQALDIALRLRSAARLSLPVPLSVFRPADPALNFDGEAK